MRHLLVARMLARVWFQLPAPCAAAENFVSPSSTFVNATHYCRTFSQLVILGINLSFKIGTPKGDKILPSRKVTVYQYFSACTENR